MKTNLAIGRCVWKLQHLIGTRESKAQRVILGYSEKLVGVL